MRIPLPNWKALQSLAARELQRGTAPQRLAFALALGFVLGCIPVIGIPTALCAMVAVLFRLNLPAIQAANYIAMPLQVALIVPFIRLGGRISGSFAARGAVDLRMLTHSPIELIRHSSVHLLEQVGVMAGQALLAWLLIAVPLVLLLTFALTGLLRRIPALTHAE
jgi:uncharacterized protein (DUF2062 family)